MKLHIPIFFFLMHSLDSEKGITGTELCRRADITYSHTLKLIKEICVPKGYVIIKFHGRCAYHFLTDKGKEIQKKIRELFDLLDITKSTSFNFRTLTNHKGISKDALIAVNGNEEIVLEDEDNDNDY